MTEKQVHDLRASLEKFNLAEIPAVNLNNTILAGHQRIKILIALNRADEEIDVRVPCRMLTIEEETEYMLRSNKNVGEWDIDKLANYDDAMLEDVGFDIDELIDGKAGSKSANFTIKCSGEAELSQIKELLNTNKKTMAFEDFKTIYLE